jgi:mannose-6-phosphate isomerase-like protein (cupin superfamily)
LNEQQTCRPWLVKFKGEFVWHHHNHEDELFNVVKGNFDIHIRDKIITVNIRGLIMPRGVEHKLVTNKEAEIMLFEPRCRDHDSTEANHPTGRQAPTLRTESNA